MLNKPAKALDFLFFNGLAIYKCAVAPFAASKTSLSAEIFFKALANPFGYLVISAAVESAKNSRFLLTASLIRVAIIGLKTTSAIPIIKIIPSNLADFFYKYATEKQLKHFPDYWFNTVKQAQCYISVYTIENTRQLTSASDKKLTAMKKLRVHQKLILNSVLSS